MLFGATLFGVLGALLAIPVAAAIQISIIEIQPLPRPESIGAVQAPPPDDTGADTGPAPARARVAAAGAQRRQPALGEGDGVVEERVDLLRPERAAVALHARRGRVLGDARARRRSRPPPAARRGAPRADSRSSAAADDALGLAQELHAAGADGRHLGGEPALQQQVAARSSP